MGIESRKIAILGGSAVGTPALIDALRRQQPKPNRVLRIYLYARTPERLNAVAHVMEQMAQGTDWLQVQATTDLDEALDGAHYVINQVRIGGLQARAYDETFPIALGIPGEETVGPGGFANALRTIPQVIKLTEEIQKRAPKALLLSFTNPASVIQYAVTKTSSLSVIGLCDAPITMIGQAAQALGVDPAELSVDYVGMHHFGFITRVMLEGRDVTQAMLDGLERVTSLDMDMELVRALGVLPTPYFRYFTQADRILEKQRAQKQTRAEQLMGIERDLLVDYAEGRPEGLAKRGAKWYDVIIAPVLMTLIETRSETFIMNVTNGTNQRWLPEDAIIETLCHIQDSAIRPLSMPEPNRELRARIQLNCAYEQLMVEAILEQSEAKALRALTMNPLIHNVAQAREVLKRIWPDALPH